jgi:hypothetical protein
MKSFLLKTAALTFLLNPSVARPKDSDDSCKGLDKRVVALISEYKGLREKRRRLPRGTFDKDLSSSGGRLENVLASLGAELGHAPYTARIIVNCVGTPDAVRSHARMRNFLEIYNREQRKAGRRTEENPGREYLIYFWRGWHDFLFFISEDGRIVDHGWWFAYE